MPGHRGALVAHRSRCVSLLRGVRDQPTGRPAPPRTRIQVPHPNREIGKMPILDEQPQRFPEQLLDELAAAPGNRSWWVLYTKARQEKSLARELWQWQVPFYLPQIRQARRVRGRRIESFLPLFSGYLFLLGDESERLQSLKTNRVSRVLPVHDADRLVFDLKQLSHLIASNAPLTVESRLQPGDRVRVRSGLLAGLEGVVLHRRGGTRLLIVVDFLQQGASVEIDDDLLEPID